MAASLRDGPRDPCPSCRTLPQGARVGVCDTYNAEEVVSSEIRLSRPLWLPSVVGTAHVTLRSLALEETSGHIEQPYGEVPERGTETDHLQKAR